MKIASILLLVTLCGCSITPEPKVEMSSVQLTPEPTPKPTPVLYAHVSCMTARGPYQNMDVIEDVDVRDIVYLNNGHLHWTTVDGVRQWWTGGACLVTFGKPE